MTRSLIIFGQGAIRCHPYVYQEMDAARDNALAAFDRLLWGHLGFSVNRGIRALAWTGSRVARSPAKGAMAPYYRHVERLSAALAVCADLALGGLGGALKRKEATSARLGDILSQLYLATAVLRYYEQYGRDSNDHRIHAQWAIENALAEAGEALDAFCRNFPVRPVGRLLRWVVVPFGQPFKRPGDSLDNDLAQLMLRENDLSRHIRREGLVYVGSKDEPTGRLLLTLRRHSHRRLRSRLTSRPGPLPLPGRSWPPFAESPGRVKAAARTGVRPPSRPRFGPTIRRYGTESAGGGCTRSSAGCP